MRLQKELELECSCCRGYCLVQNNLQACMCENGAFQITTHGSSFIESISFKIFNTLLWLAFDNQRSVKRVLRADRGRERGKKIRQVQRYKHKLTVLYQNHSLTQTSGQQVQRRVWHYANIHADFLPVNERKRKRNLYPKFFFIPHRHYHCRRY